MKPLVFVAMRTDQRKSVNATTKALKRGDLFKFVPMVCVDLNTEDVILMLAIGSSIQEHANILSSASEYIKSAEGFKNIRRVDMRPTGGRMKIEDDTLVFFDSSQKFGPFDPELLKKMAPLQLLKLFGVKSVRYEE